MWNTKGLQWSLGQQRTDKAETKDRQDLLGGEILPALCLTFVNSLSIQGPLLVFCPPVHDLQRTCPGGTWNPGASGFAPGVSDWRSYCDDIR
jgi:hypothetical protein